MTEEHATNRFCQPDSPAGDPAWARLLTPSGRGAVATIELVGDLKTVEENASLQKIPFFLARNGLPMFRQNVDAILFGIWGDEELVACRTSETSAEIHCHGSSAAITRILGDLRSSGCQISNNSPVGSDLQKNFSSPDKNSLTEGANLGTETAQEYTELVAQAKTLRTVEWLWQQRTVGPAFWKKVGEFLNESCSPPDAELIEEARKALSWSQFGMRLTSPWSVVIGGLPNVGKSSLINAILGYERAIVYDQPGTTRDVIRGETAIQGWPVIISDTAGQRQTSDFLESAGIELAVESLKKADLQILVIDQSAASCPEVAELLAEFPQALIVLNKCDLPIHPDWQDKIQTDWLKISCREQAGISALLELITARLVPETPSREAVFPVSAAQKKLLEDFLNQWG